MSDFKLKRSEFVISWEGYPRIYYFSRRLVDLKARFKRITEALPRSLQDVELINSTQELCKILDYKHIHIVTNGTEEIATDELYYGSSSSIETVCTGNNECPTLMIFNAMLDDLGETGLRQSIGLIHNASVSQCLQNPEHVEPLITLCKPGDNYSKEECTEFREKLLNQIRNDIPNIIPNTEIILVSAYTDLKHHISSLYEACIARVFLRIHAFLGGFIKARTIFSQNKMHTMPDCFIEQTFKMYLSNRCTMYEVCKDSFNTTIFSRLAHISKCVIVSPLSFKYALPQWLCNRLLHEIQLEEALVKSVSPDTKYYLRKFKQISSSFKTSTKVAKHKCASKNSSTNLSLELVVKSLLKDFNSTNIRAEKTLSSMKSLATVMGKMMFEIEGYLKQTNVLDVSTLQTFFDLDIPRTLRKEIMAIKGVYGTGTIYGQYEVHVDVQNEARVKEITNMVRTLTNRHRFPYSFTIRCIEK
ncbi:uncharacterized protein LOC132727061 [Ruditapes philippinarum]|uniref:uncharacterized protein LOC132727061 n=1 Tax=Ruditapes philippinarum TaxID=129788 RepID=UPI00295AB814|nr:uncharacterized protein LOC132727061 [Ruditapes philippinarum]